MYFNGLQAYYDQIIEIMTLMCNCFIFDNVPDKVAYNRTSGDYITKEDFLHLVICAG